MFVKKLREYIDEGLEVVPVSINFSRYHFLSNDGKVEFIERIIEIVKKYDIDPSLIEVEFTESGKIDNYEMLAEYVERLHDAGIKAAIDDYGIGYSSLELLEYVPFDIIKMDKAFADSIGTESGDTIFSSTIEAMKKLGKRIVCEVVER